MLLGKSDVGKKKPAAWNAAGIDFYGDRVGE
jgi:hypothetical protein